MALWNTEKICRFIKIKNFKKIKKTIKFSKMTPIYILSERQ